MNGEKSNNHKFAQSEGREKQKRNVLILDEIQEVNEAGNENNNNVNKKINNK